MDPVNREEMETWRRGRENLSAARFEGVHSQIADLNRALRDSIAATDDKAQKANDSLERLLIASIEGLEKMAEARADAQEVAIQKVEQATERRFEGVNEFRGAMADAASAYLPRSTFDARVEQIKQAEDALSTRLAAMAARLAGVDTRMSLGGAGLVIVITLVQLALNFWHK